MIVEPLIALNENVDSANGPVPPHATPITSLNPPDVAPELSIVRTDVLNLDVCVDVPANEIPVKL